MRFHEFLSDDKNICLTKIHLKIIFCLKIPIRLQEIVENGNGKNQNVDLFSFIHFLLILCLNKNCGTG